MAEPTSPAGGLPAGARTVAWGQRGSVFRALRGPGIDLSATKIRGGLDRLSWLSLGTGVVGAEMALAYRERSGLRARTHGFKAVCAADCPSPASRPTDFGHTRLTSA